MTAQVSRPTWAPYAAGLTQSDPSLAPSPTPVVDEELLPEN